MIEPILNLPTTRAERQRLHNRAYYHRDLERQRARKLTYYYERGRQLRREREGWNAKV